MLYSIGYEKKAFRTFLKLLREYKINCVIDVRTFPFSVDFPDYRETNLKTKLKEKDIYYMTFGPYFGERREEDITHKEIKYFDNTNFRYTDFKEVWKLKVFKEGVNRVIDGINKGFNICFMSGEKNPFESVRTFMICEYFHNLGYKITHIKDEDIIIDHETLYDRLEDNFNHQKKEYLKLKENNENNFNLFTFDKKDDKNNLFWDDFFNNYNRDKGLFLRNITLGVKEG